MFGVKVPFNDNDTAFLDERNRNTKWKDSDGNEMGSIRDYGVFKDLGLGADPPEGYQYVPTALVCAVKHDLRHKSRLIALGNRYKPEEMTSYAGVVNLRSVWILCHVAMLNKMKLWAADISCAYLEALTDEKVYTIAKGKHWGDLEGHTLVFAKALYGLTRSGHSFGDLLTDILRGLGWIQLRADPDLWYCDRDDHYKYMAVWTDDLLTASKDPAKIMKEITDFGFKLKGVGPPTYYLGGDFKIVDNVLQFGPTSYVKKILAMFPQLVGQETPTT